MSFLDRWGLQYRITASVGLGLGLILALFGYVAYWSIDQATQAALQERGDLAILIGHQLDSVFADAPTTSTGAPDERALAGVLDVAQAAPPGAPAERGRLNVQIITRQGTIVASSSPHRAPTATQHALILADLIDQRKAGVRVHEPPDGASFPRHIVAFAPLRVAGSGLWGVTVEQPEDVVLALPHKLRTRMLAAGALALLAATALAWLDTQRVVQPLRTVTAAAQRIAAGDLTVQLGDADARRRDEVGRLTTALDTMRRRLVDSLEEIRGWNQGLERRVRQRTEELAHAIAQQRWLLNKVIWAQEEERKRIARELHDDTVQTLSGLAMLLQAVEDSLPSGLVRQRERLAWARDRAAGAAGEIRQMILDLRPSALDDLGLLAAVRWYAGVRLTPLDIEVAIDAPDKQPELPAPVQTAAFRVLQEAIANVAKHARASHVRIALHAGSDALTASVKDDGQGFVPSAVRAATVAGVATLGGLDVHRAGLGLLGMQERVTLLGGTLEVRSAPGQGTLVEFTIPITVAVEAPDATAPEIATQELVPA